MPHTMRMPDAVDQISYEDLYAPREQGNWRATEIDFSVDREQWQNEFSAFERHAALWNYAMFFHGEDAVTDALSPYIDAAPREEQKYFLATQHVDEARHAVFFGRFMREVAEAGSDMAGSLDATHPELTWGFRKTFVRLERWLMSCDETVRVRSSRRRSRSTTSSSRDARPAGQHFIESYLVDRDLPGFRSGMRNVSLDEQRHIGSRVKMLSVLMREDPECLPPSRSCARGAELDGSGVHPSRLGRALRHLLRVHARRHLPAERRGDGGQAARSRDRARAASHRPAAGSAPCSIARLVTDSTYSRPSASAGAPAV